MALDTQSFLPLKAGVVVKICALAGMTAATGHHLTGSWVEDIFADRMGKDSVTVMTFATDIIDLPLEHRWVIRTVRCMTIVAGICHLVLFFLLLIAGKGCFMTASTDMTLFSFEEAIVISCMRRMTGHTTIIFVTNQMIMR